MKIPNYYICNYFVDGGDGEYTTWFTVPMRLKIIPKMFLALTYIYLCLYPEELICLRLGHGECTWMIKSVVPINLPFGNGEHSYLIYLCLDQGNNLPMKDN